MRGGRERNNETEIGTKTVVVFGPRDEHGIFF